MLILPDYNKPYLIDSLDAPLVTRHHWIFNATQVDFMLSPISYLEETSGTAYLIRVNGSEFWVPETWKVLVTDYNTYQLDTVEIETCAKIKHVAFAFIPSEQKLRTFDIEVLDSTGLARKSLVHPMINKGTALVHPVGPVRSQGQELHASIVIGPYDLHKFMGNRIVGDVFS